MEDVTDSSPFLVFERGESTFDQWLAGPGVTFFAKRSALRKVRRPPSLPPESRGNEVQILGALAVAHESGRAVGNLTPNRIVWFSAARAWRLLDLPSEDSRKLENPQSSGVATNYAAPESVLSELWQETSKATKTASDMWSFGAMVLEAILPGNLRSTWRRTVRNVCV